MIIYLHATPNYAGGSNTAHSKYKEEITHLIKANFNIGNLIDTVNVYNTNGNYLPLEQPVNTRIIIAANATPQEATSTTSIIVNEKFTLNNVTFDYILLPSGNGGLISYDNKVIAEYVGNNIYVLIDIFGNEYSLQRVQIFEHIIKTYAKEVLKERYEETSWNKSKNKIKFIKSFIDTIKIENEKILESKQNELRNLEENRLGYMRSLKRTIESITNKMFVIEQLRNTLKIEDEVFVKEFESIAAHDKVENIFLENNEIIICTNTIYTYDEQGNKYHTGKFKIRINMFNTEIRFFGDTPRKSYWTNADPHPHVSGETGHACLGNVSTTIAELCSQKQLYALVMILINFLESVNTSDVAGKNIKNWDMVDENNNIIQEGNDEEESVYCEWCNYEFDEEELIIAFEGLRRIENPVFDSNNTENDNNPRYLYEARGAVNVCGNCLRDNFYYDNRVNEYIYNDADYALPF